MTQTIDRSSIKAIGGSTIAAILSDSPWGSPYSVWLQLTGKLPPGEENAAMSRGNAAEPVIASMYALNHPEYSVETHGIVEHPEFSYLIGSPDRLLIQDGELVAGLEIKTANIMDMNQWGDEGSAEIPFHYWCQCLWYAGLLNVPVWYVAVGFVPPERRKISVYREYEVRPEPGQFDMMLNKAVRFWTEHVEADVPPPITAPDRETTRYLRSRYPVHEPDKWLEPTEEIEELTGRLLEARKVFDASEREFELCKTLMIAALGDAEGVTTSAGKITYKASKPTQKTDWKAVADSLSPPKEIIDNFTKEMPGSRRFLLPRPMK
ncbi:MAG: YqaJ viral recombinase family protein [Planctomycetaceae bacterium]|nr:YqaJ viral recombinase family protein [Planctomycetaceae bacterium]